LDWLRARGVALVEEKANEGGHGERAADGKATSTDEQRVEVGLARNSVSAVLNGETWRGRGSEEAARALRCDLFGRLRSVVRWVWYGGDDDRDWRWGRWPVG
jgi:hypothetical protein